MPDPDAPPSTSPCIGVCQMNPHTGLCEGCLRTIEEIARWSALSDAERGAVLRAVAARREQVCATPSLLRRRSGPG